MPKKGQHSAWHTAGSMKGSCCQLAQRGCQLAKWVTSQELPGNPDSRPQPPGTLPLQEKSGPRASCQAILGGSAARSTRLPKERWSFQKPQADAFLLAGKFLKDLLKPPNLCPLGA